MHHGFSIITCLTILILSSCQSQTIQPFTPPSSPVQTVALVVPGTPAPQAITTSTQVAIYTASPTRLGTASPTISPTPTFADILVKAVPFTPEPALPAGISIGIYALGRSIVAEEFGYNQVLSILDGTNMVKLDELNISRTARLAATNQSLEPFGYQLKEIAEAGIASYGYSLYQGEKILLEKINIPSSISVNRSKTDFLMIVEQSAPRHGLYLVRKDLLELLLFDETYSRKYEAGGWPLFVGDDLIYARMESKTNQSFPSIVVYRNNLEIYQTRSEIMHARPSLYGLWSYRDAKGDHWSLEVLEEVSIDGRSMNKQNNYQKSYEFHLLNGIPVFMFEKDGKVGLNLDGTEIILPGNTIPHYNCCSGSLVNPRFTDKALIFFFLNADHWNYVEMIAR